VEREAREVGLEPRPVAIALLRGRRLILCDLARLGERGGAVVAIGAQVAPERLGLGGAVAGVG
jgi:hypothetical protein